MCTWTCILLAFLHINANQLEVLAILLEEERTLTLHFVPTRRVRAQRIQLPVAQLLLERQWVAKKEKSRGDVSGER